MGMTRHRLRMTTDASGDVTAYTLPVWGKVWAVVYTKTDYANGVDITMTGAISAIPIWTGTDVNNSVVVYPDAIRTTTAGVALTYDGTRNVYDRIPVANEPIKVVVAQGGNTFTGTFDIYVGD